MSSDYVPAPHIEFLVDKYFAATHETDQRIELRRKVRSPDTGARREVMAALDARVPGTSTRLANLYRYQGKRSLQLWDLPPFARAAGAEAALDDRLARGIPGGPFVEGWVNVRGDKKRERVLRVRHDADEHELHVDVRLHGEREGMFEGEPQHLRLEHTVALKVDYLPETPVLEAVFGIQIAKRAAFLFLERVLGIAVPPRKGTEQAKFLRQITFKEPHVRALASRLALEPPVVIDGADPTDDFGERAYRGKKNGFGRDPLKRTKEFILQDATHNAERAYNVPFTHHDGYVETAEVSFVFYAQPPHITLNRTASAPLVRYIVSEVRREIGHR